MIHSTHARIYFKKLSDKQKKKIEKKVMTICHNQDFYLICIKYVRPQKKDPVSSSEVYQPKENIFSRTYFFKFFSSVAS